MWSILHEFSIFLTQVLHLANSSFSFLIPFYLQGSKSTNPFPQSTSQFQITFDPSSLYSIIHFHPFHVKVIKYAGDDFQSDSNSF